jgi:hypothetical protein
LRPGSLVFIGAISAGLLCCIVPSATVKALKRLHAVRGWNSSWRGSFHSRTTCGMSRSGMIPRSMAARRMSESARSSGIAASVIEVMRAASASLNEVNRMTAEAMSALKCATPFGECFRRTTRSERNARLSHTNTRLPATSPIGKVLSMELRMPTASVTAPSAVSGVARSSVPKKRPSSRASPNPYKTAAAETPAAELSSPETSEVDLLRGSHGRDLRRLLLTEHAHFKDHPPGHHFHEEAIRRMDLLEGEMRRRGNKVPPRPTVSTSIPAREQRVRDLDGAELMRRLFKAREVLAAESEHTGVYRETAIERDLMEAECRRRGFNLPPAVGPEKGTGPVPAFDDFSGHTTHRLKELLDMCQYELTKNEPDTVTYEDAVRDIGLIEAELRQRDEEVEEWSGDEAVA